MRMLSIHGFLHIRTRDNDCVDQRITRPNDLRRRRARGDLLMTAPQQPEPEKHCGHYEVCHVVHLDKNHKCPSDPERITCDYDTRQRNVPEELRRSIQKHLTTIRKNADGMKYLSDDEVINRCLSMMAAMFTASCERKKQPTVFFHE